MTCTRTFSTVGWLAAAALAAPAALAQDAGWYLGGGVGRSAATIDESRITNSLSGQRLDTTVFDADERDTGYRLFGGYQFSRHLALEAGWFDLGRFGFEAATSPAGSLSGNVRVRGLNLDLVGSLPLTERLSLLGRVGVAHAQTRGSFGATGAVPMLYPSASTSQRDTGLKYGAGLAWRLNEAWDVRAEAERYQIDDSVNNKGHIDVVSVGLVYRFGGSPAPVRTSAPPPAPAPYVAAAPMVQPPAPPPLPPADPAPAPRPAPVRVQFSADALFDFDKATLRPDGQRQLDAFAQQLRGVRYDGVQVIGHTDRIGSRAYNMRLAERRAKSVETYLGQAGVVMAGLSSRGVGEDQPVTAPGDCKGSKPTPALVACLQPDRRVEVEVTGSR